ncbi:MAG: NAD-dependent epimerase/dehydratase family protein [Acidobacteria bacterium]|nr:NAD-dependent epimerase/dehydratase family protein [Acidobacteriota bacterium]
MRFLVTGAAGFIGSNVVDRLLADGHEVVGFDSYVTGQREFLAGAFASPKFQLIEGDLFDLTSVVEACVGIDVVIHFAANADVRFGTEHPRRDLDQNVIVTWNVLEGMRRNGVKTIAFSSTGSVYGVAPRIPTPEDCPLPIQTSLYGASKLAAEGFISAYAEGFGVRAIIFRFVSILGERYTHGHVFDFYKQLLEHPDYLRKVGIFNLGVPGYCQLTDSIGWISNHLGLNPRLEYTGGKQGWIGDNPFIFLDCWKMCSLGWQPKLSIEAAVRRTVDYLQANKWVLEQRR